RVGLGIAVAGDPADFLQILLAVPRCVLRGRPGPAGILPFRFGRQTDRAAGLGRHLLAELLGLVPGDCFDRPTPPFEATCSPFAPEHHSPPLVLGDLRPAHPEPPADCHLVGWSLVFIPTFGPHAKLPGWDPREIYPVPFRKPQAIPVARLGVCWEW